MSLISLSGIGEAVANLDLNEATLKARLLQAICKHFPDQESLDSVTAIDPLDLIHELWAPKNAADIKAKRKNLSSLKSSINKSLKAGIKSGANPEGIIIGRDNVFIIAEEKKNLLLDKLALGDGSHSILGALAALNDMLAGIGTTTDPSEALKILDQLDSARSTLSRLAGLSSEENDTDKILPSEDTGEQADVEEFEVDDDTIIEFVEEETMPGSEEDEGGTGLGAEKGGDETNQPGPENFDNGSSLPDTTVTEADDWDSFEVVDDDFDILEQDDVADQGELEADETQGLAADVEIVGEDEEILEVESELADDIEEIDEEELAELAATEPDLDDDQSVEEALDDWDSFEVVDDEFDIIDHDDFDSQDNESGVELEALGDDVEILDEADEALEAIPELSQDDGELGEELASEANADETTEEVTDDWDSFEVMDDDFDMVDHDDFATQSDESGDEIEDLGEDVEILEEVDEVFESEPEPTTDQQSDEEIDSTEIEVVEDVEEVDEEELAELATTEPGLDTDEETAEGLPASSSDKAAAEGVDDWDSFEVEEDLDLSQPADLNQPESSSSTPALERSMDLSQYLEPEDALVNIPNILQENNDEYVRQILERFMPKFIKIPAGVYPVGGKKKRKTDRSMVKVKLPEFYIGQLPITNDLFDFFVRETGYETEAEQQGHGLVTSGRLRSAVKQETGRHTLAINKGVMTRQIRGASWRHPEGPGSSLENRGHHPVVQVSRLDALAFAAWAGKRLPSEDEWEAAARGMEGFLLPWGNESLPLANLESQQAGSTIPVNYFGRQSMSPFGLLDMLGNVFEWTSSTYHSQNGKELYILKGGSWATARITCADRLIEPATTWSNTIGFRCTVDAE